MSPRRTARAFAPGHVTGIFRPAAGGRDPRSIGSIGAGIVLDVGATAIAEWVPERPRRLQVSDAAGEPLPITEEAMGHLFGDRKGRLTVLVRLDLPVGQGFGMSAAGTLAASLAVAQLFDIPRAKAIEVAHLAELFGGGGLGGVAAILGPGLEVRERPGIPPFGRIRHLTGPASIFLGVTGPAIPTPRALSSGRLRRRIESTSSAIEELIADPTLARFARASERFTDRLGLAPPPLRSVLRDARARGAWAAQAMFGRSFFIVPQSARARARVADFLGARGVRAIEVRAGSQGAHRLPRAPFPTRRGVRKDFRGPPARRRP